MKFLLVFVLNFIFVISQTNVEDAINAIFSTKNSTNFLDGYEEVTQPPLASLGALAHCGDEEGFVCVPYYNCDSNTNTVIDNNILPPTDGSGIIDIRAGGSDRKCDHYLDVCCQRNGSQPISPTSTSRPTPTPTPTKPSTVTDATEVRSPAYCGQRNAEGIDFKITGNTNEAEFGEFPWMVAILRRQDSNLVNSNDRWSICGGSLITPVVVLTGAHCVTNMLATDIKIRAGEWDTLTERERIPYQERNVTAIIRHESFMQQNLFNDVALLILDRPLAKVENVGTVCLPKSQQLFNSKECFATGWGKGSFGRDIQYSVILKKIQLPLVPRNNCQNSLRSTRLGSSFELHRSFICAGGQPGKDTCTGDGGSPLVCPDPANPSRYIQVGIVAWGIGCGENGVPAAYVNVAEFRNWIDNKLQQLNINTEPYVI